ncbi:MAG TPA: hypothetical protein VF590_05705 [Isosphaeraceae bacterium]|jgi:RNase P subunit RPR2
MSITFACRCGQQIKAPDHAAGLKARCRHCGEQHRVPATSTIRPDTTSSGSWIILLNRAKADRSSSS